MKDITNLFIDYGSSVNSLSIISQGKIGEIINGKPEEKRAIIEEAAGVLKYKKRKEETLRKLGIDSEDCWFASRNVQYTDRLILGANIQSNNKNMETLCEIEFYKENIFKFCFMSVII